MNHPGVWVMGEVRKHIMAAGMGIVVEYAGSSGKPQWDQPDQLTWDYLPFAAAGPAPPQQSGTVTIPLVFESKFAGHGAMDRLDHQRKVLPGNRQPRPDRGPALPSGVPSIAAPMIILFTCTGTVLSCENYPTIRRSTAS